jgi:hypothetical protein
MRADWPYWEWYTGNPRPFANSRAAVDTTMMAWGASQRKR